jgi:hypothetical protein
MKEGLDSSTSNHTSKVHHSVMQKLFCLQAIVPNYGRKAETEWQLQ